MVSIAVLTLSTSGSGPGPFIIWDARIKEDVPRPILAAPPQANVFLKKSLLSILPSFSRVDHPLLDFTLTDPDVRRYRIRLFRAGNPD